MDPQRRSHRRDERGQILVIVAGGLIGLLAIVAFVLEGGSMMLNRRDAQNAADVSSIAGTHVVALNYTDTARDQSDVYNAIESSLGLNGCDPAGTGTACTWTASFTGNGLTVLGAVNNMSAPIPTGTLGVQVGVTRSPGALFGRILGFDTWDVSTIATAQTTSFSSVPTGTMLPIALCGWFDPVTPNNCIQAADSPAPGNAIDFQPGQIYDLTDGKDAPGGFGWLSWDGSQDANALSDSICTPSNPEFGLDSPFDSPGNYDAKSDPMGTNPATGETWFQIDPGKSNKSSMRACLDGWINSGATVLVPIYDIVTGKGQDKAYHITGVAAFVLHSREQPAVDNIQGYFVEYYSLTSVPGGTGSLPPGPSDTTYQLGLVQ